MEHFPSMNRRLKLSLGGFDVLEFTVVSFFILNCFTCFNETGYFEVYPPTLEEYLPLDEILLPAPDIEETTTELPYIYHDIN